MNMVILVGIRSDSVDFDYVPIKYSVIVLLNQNISKTKLFVERFFKFSRNSKVELFLVSTAVSEYCNNYLKKLKIPDGIIVHKVFSDKSGVTARNDVIPKCIGKYIFLIDNDVIVAPGWFFKNGKVF
jgi:glycerol-3-phosphate responsive antiterminator